tara:strand:+ start:4821 stop:5348 length:528 start_codon:yes stop_codon:yes gene_type:complete
MKLKTVNIKGKEYVEVNERLIYFRKHFPKHSLITEVIEKTENSILIMAYVIDENDNTIATGLAEEIKGSTFINKTSYVENCETSAWGRALANFGIGLDTSVASADEVSNAIANSEVSSKTPKKPLLKLGTANWVKAQKWIDANKSKGMDSLVNTLETKYSLSANAKSEIKKILAQ